MNSKQIALWIKKKYPTECSSLAPDFYKVVSKLQKMIEEAFLEKEYLKKKGINFYKNQVSFEKNVPVPDGATQSLAEEDKRSDKNLYAEKNIKEHVNKIKTNLVDDGQNEIKQERNNTLKESELFHENKKALIVLPLFYEKQHKEDVAPQKTEKNSETKIPEQPLLQNVRLVARKNVVKAKDTFKYIKECASFFKKESELLLSSNTEQFYGEEYNDSRYKNTDDLKTYLRQSDANRIKTEPQFERIKEIIDTMSEVRFDAEESAKQNTYRFLNKRYELPVSWEQLDNLFTRQADSDQPPRRLITKIADKIPLIEQTVSGLRKVLTRERKKVNISRAEQLDSQCMQWLTKQPGVSPAQKAGTRQQIMAVVRQESYNTLENRVLKDFLHRANNEAEQYLRIFSKNPKFVNSDRIKKVKRLSALCIKSLSMPEMQKIACLYEVPHPNYVLQQNPNYAQIWGLYRKLLHQTRLTELIWPKRYLLVYEHLLLWMVEHLRFNTSNDFKKMFFSDLWVLDSAEKGCFFRHSKWRYFLENGADFFEFSLNGKKNNLYDFVIRKNNKSVNVSFVFIPSFVSSFHEMFNDRGVFYVFYNESSVQIPNRRNFFEINIDVSFDTGLSEIFSSLMEALS